MEEIESNRILCLLRMYKKNPNSSPSTGPSISFLPTAPCSWFTGGGQRKRRKEGGGDTQEREGQNKGQQKEEKQEEEMEQW